jgi:hypothetical protein
MKMITKMKGSQISEACRQTATRDNQFAAIAEAITKKSGLAKQSSSRRTYRAELKAAFAVVSLGISATTCVWADSYTKVLPTGSSLLANHFDHGTNRPDVVFSSSEPLDGNRILKHNCAAWDVFTFDSTSPTGFSDSGGNPIPAPLLPPGEGFFFDNTSGSSLSLVFSGTPVVPILPPTFPCGTGHLNLLGCQTNAPGNYTNIIGSPPANGAQEQLWNGAGFVVYTFTNGAWSPSDPPALGIGQAAMFYVPAAVTVDYPKVLIPKDASWTYLADGTAPPVTWKDTNYNDSSWPSGLALFGFETTPDEYPWPFRTFIQPPNQGGQITTYYRSHFQWTGSTSNVVLVATNYVDDGAAFYLNGVEVGRLRLPPGPLNPGTLAFNQPNEGQPDVWSFSAANLNEGDNIIAVEVHQVSTASSDVVFGMELEARFSPVDTNTNTNQLQVRQSGSFIVITWSGAATLQTTPSLQAPVIWTDVTTNTPYTTLPDAPKRFYRLRMP